MNYADPELRERLAAEYALGALSGLSRRRFERLLSSDRDLGDLVEDWELRLNLLIELAPPVEPRAQVWDEIAAYRAGTCAGTRRLARCAVGQPQLLACRDWFGSGHGGSPGLLCRFPPPACGAGADRGVRRAARMCIEGAARGLAGVPGDIAALGDRLAGLATRVDAVASRPTHVAVLLDKDQRPMMTADLDCRRASGAAAQPHAAPRFHRQRA